jgi:hypothetical protein
MSRLKTWGKGKFDQLTGAPSTYAAAVNKNGSQNARNDLKFVQNKAVNHFMKGCVNSYFDGSRPNSDLSSYIDDVSVLRRIGMEMANCIFSYLNDRANNNTSNLYPYFLCSNYVIVYISDRLTKPYGVTAELLKNSNFANIMNVLDILIRVRETKVLSMEESQDYFNKSDSELDRIAKQADKLGTEDEDKPMSAIEAMLASRAKGGAKSAPKPSFRNVKTAPAGAKVSELAAFLGANMVIMSKDEQLKQARASKKPATTSAPVLEGAVGGEPVFKKEFMIGGNDDGIGGEKNIDTIFSVMQSCAGPMAMKYKMLIKILPPGALMNSMQKDGLDNCVTKLFKLSTSDAPIQEAKAQISKAKPKTVQRSTEDIALQQQLADRLAQRFAALENQKFGKRRSKRRSRKSRKRSVRKQRQSKRRSKRRSRKSRKRSVRKQSQSKRRSRSRKIRRLGKRRRRFSKKFKEPEPLPMTASLGLGSKRTNSFGLWSF